MSLFYKTYTIEILEVHNALSQAVYVMQQPVADDIVISYTALILVESLNSMDVVYLL